MYRTVYRHTREALTKHRSKHPEIGRKVSMRLLADCVMYGARQWKRAQLFMEGVEAQKTEKAKREGAATQLAAALMDDAGDSASLENLWQALAGCLSSCAEEDDEPQPGSVAAVLGDMATTVEQMKESKSLAMDAVSQLEAAMAPDPAAPGAGVVGVVEPSLHISAAGLLRARTPSPGPPAAVLDLAIGGVGDPRVRSPSPSATKPSRWSAAARSVTLTKANAYSKMEALLLTVRGVVGQMQVQEAEFKSQVGLLLGGGKGEDEHEPGDDGEEKNAAGRHQHGQARRTSVFEEAKAAIMRHLDAFSPAAALVREVEEEVRRVAPGYPVENIWVEQKPAEQKPTPGGGLRAAAGVVGLWARRPRAATAPVGEAATGECEENSAGPDGRRPSLPPEGDPAGAVPDGSPGSGKAGWKKPLALLPGLLLKGRFLAAARPASAPSGEEEAAGGTPEAPPEAEASPAAQPAGQPRPPLRLPAPAGWSRQAEKPGSPPRRGVSTAPAAPATAVDAFPNPGGERLRTPRRASSGSPPSSAAPTEGRGLGKRSRSPATHLQAVGGRPPRRRTLAPREGWPPELAPMMEALAYEEAAVQRLHVEVAKTQRRVGRPRAADPLFEALRWRTMRVKELRRLLTEQDSPGGSRAASRAAGTWTAAATTPGPGTGSGGSPRQLPPRLARALDGLGLEEPSMSTSSVEYRPGSLTERPHRRPCQLHMISTDADDLLSRLHRGRSHEHRNIRGACRTTSRHKTGVEVHVWEWELLESLPGSGTALLYLPQIPSPDLAEDILSAGSSWDC